MLGSALFYCALLAIAANGKQQVIRFPPNDRSYDRNIVRKWNVGSATGTCLEFKLQGLNTELSDGCNNDFLDVYDGPSNQSSRRMHICGTPNPMPKPVVSSGNKLHIIFNSNANYETGRGFEAMVTEMACGGYQPNMNLQPSCGIPQTNPIESGLYNERRRRQATDYDGFSNADQQVDSEEGRIVGGQVAKPNSWPWQVSIRYNGMHICGGSVVSPRGILSAAHCFKTVSRNPDDFEFWVGKHLKDPREPQNEQRVYGESIRIHPDYEKGGKKHDNDLAVIILRTTIRFTPTVTPVCLPWDASFQPREGSPCYVTGFGTTKGTGGDDALKQAAVPIVANERCQTMDQRLQPLLTKNMLCAGYDGGRHDSCQGDSGGPLVCKIGPQNSWVLSGVVSFGFGCAGRSSPGVYARVAEFLPWLRENIADLPK